MDSKIKKTYLWWIAYLLIEILLIYILKYKVSKKICWLGLAGLLYIYVNVLFREYKREQLFVNGIVSYVSVVLTGLLLGNLLSPTIILILGMVASVTDILSFTKYGQNTANAKAMAEPKYLYRLMVYGKGKGEELYPTCGIGDYLYFAMWIGGLCENIKMLWLLGMGVLIGNMMNMFFAHILRTKSGYKGIPAVPLPFICVMVLYCASKVWA